MQIAERHEAARQDITLQKSNVDKKLTYRAAIPQRWALQAAEAGLVAFLVGHQFRVSLGAALGQGLGPAGVMGAA
jgi:hypothetical protein